MRRPGSIVTSLAVALSALLLSATSALGNHCYPGNTGAIGIAGANGQVIVNAKGVKAEFKLRAANAVAVPKAIAHPTQVGSNVNSDFAGLGTYRGFGPASCTDNPNDNWRTYSDGQSFGVYYCNTLNITYPDATAGFQNLEIRYTTCNSPQARWCEYIDGVFKTVQSPNMSAGFVSGGGESVNAAVQNIAIDYRNMRYRNNAGNLVLWPQIASCIDVGYGLDVFAAHTYNVVLD
jgi:hypothetical protein